MDERDQVDEVVRGHGARRAPARSGRSSIDPWGGRSGYVADPEGNRWEIAWAPGLMFDERGAVLGFGGSQP